MEDFSSMISAGVFFALPQNVVTIFVDEFSRSEKRRLSPANADFIVVEEIMPLQQQDNW